MTTIWGIWALKSGVITKIEPHLCYDDKPIEFTKTYINKNLYFKNLYLVVLPKNVIVKCDFIEATSKVRW